jgi:Alpha/beta hydrolase domain
LTTTASVSIQYAFPEETNMKAFSGKRIVETLAVVIAFAGTGLAQTPAAGGVPIPKWKLIPATAGSAPFLSAERNLVPPNLAKAGYVEEEFIVGGFANVYDWKADGSVSVKTPKVPYSTRILVRRPANAARFSGNVVVEILHSARRFDWPMMWGYSHDFFMENGDAWVGISTPNVAAGLKTFNPTRYAEISFANPSKEPCAPNGAVSETEEGLRWDAISQVAALLKSNVADRPLAALTVEAVFLTMQGGDLQTYINAIHPLATLANGKPAYDGYLLKSPAAPVRISQCATAPTANDPRRAIRKTNVPVIAVVAQGEVIDAVPFRRADSDAADDKFRLYEVSGAGHIDKSAYGGFPMFPDQIAAVGSAQGNPEWPFNVTCEPPIPMMPVPLMSYAFDAAFASLEQWARKGTPAPRAERIQIANPGGPGATVVADADGHATGGVRSTYVDVPAAKLATNSAGPGVCREMGKETPFDQGRFQSLYPNAKAYTDKVTQAADRLVKERWLTEADGRRIKQEAQTRASK